MEDHSGILISRKNDIKNDLCAAGPRNGTQFGLGGLDHQASQLLHSNKDCTQRNKEPNVCKDGSDVVSACPHHERQAETIGDAKLVVGHHEWVD